MLLKDPMLFGRHWLSYIFSVLPT